MKSCMIALMVPALLLVGCVRAKVVPTETQSNESAYFSYAIALNGESLTSISKWFTGDASAWRTFFIQPKDPKTLRKGDIVLIPTESLVRTDPPSEAFVKEQQRKSLDTVAETATENDELHAELHEESSEDDEAIEDAFLDTLANSPTPLPAQ